MSFVVKNTTFPGLLELVAPHSCRGCGQLGTVLCECCKKYIIRERVDKCPNCGLILDPESLTQEYSTSQGRCPNCIDLPPIYAVGAREGVLAALIHDLKYHSVRAAAASLAELLDAVLPELPIDTVIVPLPTIRRHIRERGLDHTWLIAKCLAYKRGLTARQELVRAHDSVQVGTDRTQRLEQAHRAYSAATGANISPSTTYLLLDDVWTTGASMHGALAQMQATGAKKLILAVLGVSGQTS